MSEPLKALIDGARVALLQPEWLDIGGTEKCPLCGADRFEGKHDAACLRVNFGMFLGAEPLAGKESPEP